MAKVIIKKGRDESIKRFHPWVFSGAVEAIEGEPKEGDIVTVCSYNGQVLACGHYQIGSITVRILCFDTPSLPTDFWEERLKKAIDLRWAIGLYDNDYTNCYRLVHGEGDFLPGLIIDYYDGHIVMQAHSAGMFLARERIARALQHVYENELLSIYDKSSQTAPFKAGLELQDGYLYGECDSEETIVLENNHQFFVNWEEGQKTGFFLDQRENRALVEKYAAGRNVLNLFCYTGGFSVYALSGGAACVDSVDSSKKAINLTQRNVELNNLYSHNAFCEDAIDFLHNSPDGKYDMIIVDPPAFAKHRGAIDNALRAYKRLNASAIEKIAHGGIIFTFSCSQVVDKNAFALAVFSAAAQCGRNVRIIDRLNQPGDHPVNIYHPEGEYLKGLVLFVE